MKVAKSIILGLTLTFISTNIFADEFSNQKMMCEFEGLEILITVPMPTSWTKEQKEKACESICNSLQKAEPMVIIKPATKKEQPAAYEKLTPSVRAINARYFNILNNVSFLICWTNEGKLIGSTGQAMRLATYLHIPIYNLGIKETLDKMVTKIQQRSDELIPYRSISSGIF